MISNAIGFSQQLRIKQSPPTLAVGASLVGPFTIFPSPSQRIVAIVSSLSITFWSGDSSRNEIIGEWPYDTSPLLLKRHQIIGPSRPLQICWKEDETAMTILFSHGILIILTIESVSDLIQPDVNELLPSWANVNGTSSSHATLSHYPRKIRISNVDEITGMGMASGSGSAFCPLSMVVTTGKLLFGGGTIQSRIEYINWNTNTVSSTGTLILRPIQIIDAKRNKDKETTPIGNEHGNEHGNENGIDHSNSYSSSDVSSFFVPEGSFSQLHTFKGRNNKRKGGIVGYVTTENCCGVLFVSNETDQARNISTFHPWNNVTTIAMDGSTYRLAVGDKDGLVHIYQLKSKTSVANSNTFKSGKRNKSSPLLNLVEIFKYSTIDFNARKNNVVVAGHVQCLAFAPEDGKVIAVSHSEGSVNVVTVTNRNIFTMQTKEQNRQPKNPEKDTANTNATTSTNVHDPNDKNDQNDTNDTNDTNDKNDKNEEEATMNIMTNVEWNRHGYGLLIHNFPVQIVAVYDPSSTHTIPHNITHNSTQNNESNTTNASVSSLSSLLLIHFLKIPFQLTSCISNILISTNHMYCFTDDLQARGRHRWRRLDVPPSYSYSNLPLRLVTATTYPHNDEIHSISSKRIAVAGQRGFAIYHCNHKAWTIFGNIHLEQRIRVESMVWYSSRLLVTVEAKDRIVTSKQTPIPTVEEINGIYDQKIIFYFIHKRTGLDETNICGSIDVPTKWKVNGISFIRDATNIQSRYNESNTESTTESNTASRNQSNVPQQPLHLMIVTMSLSLPTHGLYVSKMLIYNLNIVESNTSTTSSSNAGNESYDERNNTLPTAPTVTATLLHTTRLPRSTAITNSFVVEKFHRKGNATTSTGSSTSSSTSSTTNSNTNSTTSSTTTSANKNTATTANRRRRRSSSWSTLRFHYIYMYLTSAGVVQSISFIVEKRNRTIHVADRAVTPPQFINRPVEFIWNFTQPHHRRVPQHLRSSVWVHGVKYGIQLWEPGLQSSTVTLPPDTYDSENMPLGPSSTLGLFLSVSTDPFVSENNVVQCESKNSLTNIESSICYELRTLSKPCIHNVINCCIAANLMNVTQDILEHCFTSYPDFVKLGELLVREALERTYEENKKHSNANESSTTINDTASTFNSSSSSSSLSSPSSPSSSSSSSSVLLQRILLFLRSYVGYEEIIMRCGRRAERNRWPILFPLAGQPRDLFETAVLQRKYQVASSLLVIMDTIEEIPELQNSRNASPLPHAPSRISEKNTIEKSYENTSHVLACGRRLIELVKQNGKKEENGANGINEFFDVEHLDRYLQRLDLKRKELLSLLRNL